jgi:hypothetical protein
MANPEPQDEYETIEVINGIELMKTSTCFAVFYDIDTTGDGYADDREMETFDTEAEARDFITALTQ